MATNSRDPNSTRPKYKKLHTAQTIKACDWLRANWESVKANPPTKAELAARMSADLKFTVPLGSVGALVTALGFTWPGSSGTRSKPDPGQTIELARHVRDLWEIMARERGIPQPPDSLRSMADGKPPAELF